jgi:hypothetical protein
VSLLIDTNVSFGPARWLAFPNALKGEAETLPIPCPVKRLTC